MKPVSSDSLARIGRAQRERLFHVEFCALFLGEVRRAQLMQRFGIAEAAATRDIALYRGMAPENLSFDARHKLYRPSPAMTPLFAHDAQASLVALADGLGDDAAVPPLPHVRAERPVRPTALSLDVVAAVSQAIAAQTSLDVEYISTRSGRARRTIAPHALVDNGLRWHVRAFDAGAGAFRDFLLGRMGSPRRGEAAPEAADREHDEQWMRIVRLELKPHPRIAHPDAIVADFGMRQGRLELKLRAALVGYVARAWGIDTSSDASAPPDAFPVWLANRETLYDVESLSFAPGA